MNLKRFNLSCLATENSVYKYNQVQFVQSRKLKTKKAVAFLMLMYLIIYFSKEHVNILYSYKFHLINTTKPISSMLFSNQPIFLTE